MRVPTPNVSLVDLKFVAKRATSEGEINDAMKRRGAGSSSRAFSGASRANWCRSISTTIPPRPSFALDQTKVMDGTLVRVMAWYDNEWGFSNRMADTAVAMGKLI